MKTNNENRRGTNPSGASRDGKSFERRDVKSILKGTRGDSRNNERDGGNRQNSNEFRKNDEYKPRFSAKKFDKRDDKPGFGEKRNFDNKRTYTSTDRKPFGDKENRGFRTDDNKKSFNSDRKPFVNREGNRFNPNDNKRPYNSEHKPFGNREDRGFTSSDNKRPYNPERKPFGNREDRGFTSNDNKRPYNSERKPFGNREDRGFTSNDNKRPFNPERKPFGNREDRGFTSERPRFERKTDRNEEPRGDKLTFKKASDVTKSEYVETRFDNKKNGITFRRRNSDDNYDPNAKYSKKKQLEYQKTIVDPTKPIRLNKFLANAGVCSRREADEYIQAGVITVNDAIVNELGVKVLPTDKVMFHNQPVRSERKVYILLNKPKDCVTTSEDTHSRLTVLDLVKNACSERIYPVGRLDRNTTGVLLLTNDGDLASKLTHPKYNKKKIYHVALDKELEKADFEAILSGIEIDDFTIAADALEFVKEDSMKEVGIEIHSGQNRIVRRIFEKLGYKILRLDRVFFAGLTKKNVPRGKYRFLTDKEVGMLKMGAHE